jgi:hypothetical protein
MLTLVFQTTWQFEVDNTFATSFHASSSAHMSSQDMSIPNMCNQCQKLDFTDPKLVIVYHFWYIQSKAEQRSCDLCAMFYSVATSSLLPTSRTGLVRFDRDGSTLRIGGDGPRVLSIVGCLSMPCCLITSSTPRADVDILYSFLAYPDVTAQGHPTGLSSAARSRHGNPIGSLETLA